MAGRFSPNQWDSIEAKLLEDPAKYGVPDGGREESAIFASFNIRKLSRFKGRERELKFLARFCARCDLLAVQEIQDDLSGVRYLRDQMDERVSSAGEFGIVVSDITGRVPGGTGMAERLAFIYRRNRVQRLDMASDLTVDRSDILRRFEEHEDVFTTAWDEYKDKRAKFEAGQLSTKPKPVLPAFLTFTRTPHVAAFEMPAAGVVKPVAFIAVNAHLLFGTPGERRDEFRELVRWMTARLKDEKKMFAPNFVLLGDMNLDLDDPNNDRAKAEAFIGELKKEAFGSVNSPRIYFPFIGDHPRTGDIVRTNARHSQTFDQVGFFLGKSEKHLPRLGAADGILSGGPDSFDYGVFDFAELFANTILNKSYRPLSKAEKIAFGKHFEHSVSDHMPIWVRIPRPGF